MTPDKVADPDPRFDCPKCGKAWEQMTRADDEAHARYGVCHECRQHGLEGEDLAP